MMSENSRWDGRVRVVESCRGNGQTFFTVENYVKNGFGGCWQNVLQPNWLGSFFILPASTSNIDKALRWAEKIYNRKIISSRTIRE